MAAATPLLYRIYTLRDPLGGPVRYVGITRQRLSKRLSQHVRRARDGAKLHGASWIRSLAAAGRTPLITEVEATCDPMREAFWVGHFLGAGCDLTNATSGGISEFSHSEEARAKIAEAGRQRFKDLAGLTIGRLSVQEIHSHRPVTWLCLCSCGQRRVVLASHLLAQATRSCGCLSREGSAQRARDRARHGMWKSKEYLTWIEMRARCNNPRHARYSCNGARGVRVCPEWQRSFEQFLADMGPKPADHVLMRKDPAQGYEPANCLWATRSQLRSTARDTQE